MLRKVFALGLTGLALSAALATAGTMVSYPSGSETVSGYAAAPDGPGKKPAVVVIHEWWGLNDFAKAKADGFAAQGYVALAVDLYRGKVAPDADVAHQLMRGLPDDRAIRDLKAAVAYLRSRPDVEPSKVGSVGWCMGGGLSLDLAVAGPSRRRTARASTSRSILTPGTPSRPRRIRRCSAPRTRRTPTRERTRSS